MKYFIKQFILLTLVVLGINLKAQQYPVQTVVQVNTPHTLSMSDYHSSSFEKLKVTLINTDFQKPSINVIMRMSITGPNQSIKTKAYILEANPPVFTLNYGTPLVISSVTNSTEMNWFFNPDNLDFTGITKSQYIANGQKLEEGLYQFCFEVYEETTNNLVSGKRCTMAWLALLDPPLLNLPLEAANLPNTPGFQSINFTWTPRHLSNPQMAFNTEYDFQIREIIDTMATAASVFANNSLTNLYEITQSQTYLNLSNTYPLSAGKRYAWRVKAKFTQGSYEAVAFNNDGYSEARWFKFQNGCPRVDTVNATKINPHQVKLTWNQNSNHTDFKVKYKEQGTTQWYDISCKQSPAYMTNLKPKTTYIFKLGSTCIFGEGFDDQNSNWSDEFSVTTDSMNVENEPNCGIIEPASSIANQTPITTLYQNDVIFAGKYFPVFITSISGSGTFSGEGYIGIPAYAKAQLKVRFVNIKVNTDKQLISGYIETTFDPDMNGLFDGTQFVDGGTGVGSVKTGTSSAEIYTTFPITNISQITYTVVDGKVVVTISTSTGTKTVTIDKLPISIQDSNGKIYGIAKDGSKYVIGQTGIALRQTRRQLDSLSTDKGSAIFLDYPEKQYYAFDKYESVYESSLLFRECYQVIPKNGGASAYHVASKLTVASKPDFVKVTVTLTGSGMIQDSVKFITSRGTQFEKTLISGTTYEVKIVGGPESDAQEIFAMYPADSGRFYTLGKLLVPSYKQQNRKVVLVPVGNVSTTGLKDSVINELNREYSTLGIDWEVSLDSIFNFNSWDENSDGKLEVIGNKFSRYSDEMLNLNNAYISENRHTVGVAYIFILPFEASISNVIGDLPRGCEFGYLFNKDNVLSLNVIKKTVSHELGHSLKLMHCFDKIYGLQEGQLTSNVMDYPNGLNFAKLQWDQLHSPGIVIGILESQEDGFNKVVKGQYVIEEESTFVVTPHGYLLKLYKGDIISLSTFSFKINNYNNSTAYCQFIPNYVVTSFTTNNVAHGSLNKKTFSTRYINKTQNLFANSINDLNVSAYLNGNEKYEDYNFSYYAAGNYKIKLFVCTDALHNWSEQVSDAVINNMLSSDKLIAERVLTYVVADVDLVVANNLSIANTGGAAVISPNKYFISSTGGDLPVLNRIEQINKTILVDIAKSVTPDKVVIVKTNNPDATKSGPTNYYIQNDYLKSFLSQKQRPDEGYFIIQNNQVFKVTSTTSTVVSITPSELKTKILNKDFTGVLSNLKFAVYSEYDEENRQWEILVRIKPLSTKAPSTPTALLNNSKVTPSSFYSDDEIKLSEGLIEKKLAEIIKNRNDRLKANSTIDPQAYNYNGPWPCGENGEFKQEKLAMLEMISEVYEFGKEVVFEGQMPSKTWKSKDASLTQSEEDNIKNDYNKSAFHMPNVIAGPADGLIDEMTGISQLVGLGLNVVQNPFTFFKGVYTSVSTLDIATVKKMATDASGISDYQAGGDRAYYRGGKQAVQIATFFITGGLKEVAKSGEEMIAKSGALIEKAQKFVTNDNSIAENIKNACEKGRKVFASEKRLVTTIEDAQGHKKVVLAERNADKIDIEEIEITQSIDDIPDDIIDEMNAEEISVYGNSSTAKEDLKTQPQKFKDGKAFEKRMRDDPNTRSGISTKSGIDLTGHTKLEQVQIKTKNGSYFIADEVYVKYNSISKNYDVVIAETKLSSYSPFTSNQDQFLLDLHNGEINFELRSKIFDSGAFGNIKQGSTFEVKKVVKIEGDGTVNGTAQFLNYNSVSESWN